MTNSLELAVVRRVVETAKKAGVEIPPEVAAIAERLECGSDGYAAWPRWQTLHPGEEEPPEAMGCCAGSAVYGPERCTCWTPVYDVDQTDPILPVPDGSIQVRTARCGDCAYRKDSPERADQLTEEELIGLAIAGTPFWCHDGMRRPVAYRHPVLGDVPARTDDWRPPKVSGVPFRRDGSPGLLCAGWAQEVRRQERLTAADGAARIIFRRLSQGERHDRRSDDPAPARSRGPAPDRRESPRRARRGRR